MRNAVIVLVTAVVLVLVNQSTAEANPPFAQDEASALVVGVITCTELRFGPTRVEFSTDSFVLFPGGRLSSGGFLGLQGTAVYVQAPTQGSCADLVSTVAGSAPDCTVSSPSSDDPFFDLISSVVCSGSAGDVTSAVAALSRAVVSLPPPRVLP